ncbi:MAG TPA: copper transporter [Acidimicrobiales bacterium]|jgi:hypothetical protein|nr:copper transporter [Acidimicrobiales bacterium]
MVNFRFHLLSLTAVFLALAVGIAVGATVVDRATVDALHVQLRRVEGRVKENVDLRNQVQDWQRFADQAGDGLVVGRLSQVPVLLIGVRGIDKTPIDRLRQSLTKAGALVEGTVWFTSKLKLEKADDVTALAQILGVPNGRPDELRRALVSRLAASWAGSGETNPLPALLDKAFAEFEQASVIQVEPATVPRPETRFLIASDATADVGNEQLGVPLAAQMAKSFPSRVVAVEPAGVLFLGPLRLNEQAVTQMSTVDNVADFRGRMAAVLALQELGQGKVGQYGVGTGAKRLMPESAQ